MRQNKITILLLLLLICLVLNSPSLLLFINGGRWAQLSAGRRVGGPALPVSAWGTSQWGDLLGHPKDTGHFRREFL